MMSATSATATAPEQRSFYRLGGVSFVAAGLLFLVKFLFELSAGQAPRDATGVLAWRSASEFPIAMANEFFFVAAIFLVPAVIALYRALDGGHRVAAATGCAILAALIPVLIVLDIVHGRFVYPILGFRVETPDVAALVLALYLGGLHAAALTFGVATLFLSVAMLRGSFGKAVGYLGLAVAVSDIVSGYPEVIGPTLYGTCQVLFSAWFVAVGATLYRLPGFERTRG